MDLLLKTGTRVAITLFAILCITVVAYAPGLSGDYLFDDFPNIVDNKHIQITTLDLASLQSAAFSMGVFLDRPISMISFALNHYFFGIAPLSFKAVNLGIHLANGIALFVFVVLLLKAYKQRFAPSLSTNSIRLTALVATAVWILHPINLTSVLYVVQRMTSLSGFFVLVGLICYLHVRRLLFNGQASAIWLWITTAAALIFAVFAKENGALLPLYLVTIEFTLFKFRKQDHSIDKRIVAFFLAWLAFPALIALGWFSVVAPHWISEQYAWREFTPVERLLTESRIVFYYLRLIFVPSISELGVYHDDIPISTGLFSPPSTVFSLIAIIGLIVIALLLRSRQPLASLAILWFFAGHSMESTIIPLEIVHEHRNYLPSAGILAITVFMILNGKLGLRSPPTQQLVVAALIGALLLTTHLRATQWSNNITQAEYEFLHHPESPRALAAVGRIRANIAIFKQQANNTSVVPPLEKAGQIDHRAVLPYAVLIMYSFKTGQNPDPSWIQKIRERLSEQLLGPGHVNAIRSIVRCQLDPAEGCKLADAIVQDFFLAALHSRIPQSPRIRADFLTYKAEYLFQGNRDIDGALESFRLAIAEQPNQIQYRVNFIRALILLGDHEAAQKELDEIEERTFTGANTKEINQFRNEVIKILGVSG